MVQKLHEIQNSQLKWQKNPQENPDKETRKKITNSRNQILNHWNSLDRFISAVFFSVPRRPLFKGLGYTSLTYQTKQNKIVIEISYWAAGLSAVNEKFRACIKSGNTKNYVIETKDWAVEGGM